MAGKNKDGTKNIYKDRINYSEQTIQRVLYDHFKKMNYLTSNIYMFGQWETDFFFMAKNRHMWEIEIKVDRQDFHRDFELKPKKHRLFKEVFESGDRRNMILPNCFVFCAPEGVIPHDEVPEYAGLIEMHGEGKNKLKYIGKIPKIHSEVQDVDTELLKKFYNAKLRLEKQMMEYRIKLFEARDEADREEATKKFLKTIRM